MMGRFLARVAVGGLLILLLPIASIVRGGMAACGFAAGAVSTAIAAWGAPWGRVFLLRIGLAEIPRRASAKASPAGNPRSS